MTNQDDFLLEMSDGHQIDIDGYYLNMDWTIGDYTIYSVTGLRDQDSHLPSTYTGEVFETLFDATRDDERETFQQEIRLVSNFDGPLNFVTGLYYQEEDIDFCVVQVVGFVDLLLDGEPTFLSQNPLILCNAQEAEATGRLYIDGTYDVIGPVPHQRRLPLHRRGRRVGSGRPRRADPGSARWRLSTPTFTWRELGDPLEGTNWARFPDGVVTDDEDWQEPTYRLHFSYDFSDDLFGWAGLFPRLTRAAVTTTRWAQC